MIMYRNRNCENGSISLWVVAIAYEIALIAAAIVFASIVAISRARVDNIPMTGIPSIDQGIYPDAHVEEVEDVIKETN